MPRAFSHKLLVVALEKNSRAVIKKILDDMNREYICPDSAGSALEQMENAESAFSIILSDQDLPDLSGPDFLEKVKSLSPDSIRFLLSDQADILPVIDAVNKGIIHHIIQTPVETETFKKLVSRALVQYEKAVENGRLLHTAKKQNKKLYDLGSEFLKTLEQHEKKIAELDREIEALQRPGKQKNQSSQQIYAAAFEQVKTLFFQKETPDTRKAERFCLWCISQIYKEFEDLALRNGFEMPIIQSGRENG